MADIIIVATECRIPCFAHRFPVFGMDMLEEHRQCHRRAQRDAKDMVDFIAPLDAVAGDVQRPAADPPYALCAPVIIQRGLQGGGQALACPARFDQLLVCFRQLRQNAATALGIAEQHRIDFGIVEP